jgi:hypothetical protein
MSTEIKSIRDKYGEQIEIIILGDFNARIGNDGGELYASRENSEDMVVSGRFGFPEKNENGYRLTLFCKIMNLKIMDSFFMRPNNDYGTWRSARSTTIDYTAALDHIFVSEPWWSKVEQCGVTDDTFHMPTDHRIIELVIQEQDTGNVMQRKQKGERPALSDEVQHTINKSRLSKLLLHCRSHTSPEHTKALKEIKMEYEVAVQREKEKLQAVLSTESLLEVLDRAVTNVIANRWPDGMPAVPEDSPRCWYEDKDGGLKEITKNKERLIKKWKFSNIVLHHRKRRRNARKI